MNRSDHEKSCNVPNQDEPEFARNSRNARLQLCPKSAQIDYCNLDLQFTTNLLGMTIADRNYRFISDLPGEIIVNWISKSIC